jgi:hypothetical protein
MAVGTLGTTPSANFIPEVWANEVSDATQARTVLGALVDRQWESQLKFGDTIHIVDASNPAVRIKSEDTSATFSNITETMQNIQVTRHAYVGFLVEQIAETQASISLRSLYTNKAGYSLTAFMEGDATSGLVSLGNGFSQSVGTLGQDPTLDNLIRAVQYLDDGDVPEEDRYFAVTPAIHAALLKMDAFTSRDYGAENALQRAMVGDVLGTRVYKTSLLNNNPAAANQGYGWFCHKFGVALIVQQQPEVHSQWDLKEFGFGTMIDTFYQFAERLIAPSTLGGSTSTDRFNVAVCGA